MAPTIDCRIRFGKESCSPAYDLFGGLFIFHELRRKYKKFDLQGRSREISVIRNDGYRFIHFLNEYKALDVGSLETALDVSINVWSQKTMKETPILLRESTTEGTELNFLSRSYTLQNPDLRYFRHFIDVFNGYLAV